MSILGRITTEFTVWCVGPNCAEWDQQACVRNKAEAIKNWQEKGWRIKKRKWTCPKCVKENKSANHPTE